MITPGACGKIGAQHRRGRSAARKHFFFEKKKQKTFDF
jgi:hypothetical protein